MPYKIVKYRNRFVMVLWMTFGWKLVSRFTFSDGFTDSKRIEKSSETTVPMSSGGFPYSGSLENCAPVGRSAFEHEQSGQ